MNRGWRGIVDNALMAALPRRPRQVRWTLMHKGRFADRVTGKVPGLRHKMHLLIDGHIKPPRDVTAKLLPVLDLMPLPPAPEEGFRITWVGHATFVIQGGGKTFLTDPIWSKAIMGIPRLVRPGVAWEHLPPIDGVLLSHNHYDHLDTPTIKRLPRDTPIVCPLGMARWFRKRGFTDVRELDWWEGADLAGLRVDFVPVHHWSRRHLFDTNDTLWGGHVLTFPDAKRVFFGGDSAYGPHFKAIGERFPGIDAALLGIGAYAPRWYNSGAHASPEEAVQMMADLGAKTLVPMHWGTFRLSPEPVWEPVELIVHAWSVAGHADDALWLLRHGESRVSGKPRQHPILEVPPAARRISLLPDFARVPAHEFVGVRADIEAGVT